MKSAINYILFWTFVGILIYTFVHFWHILMTGNIPEGLYSGVKGLIFQAFAAAIAGISAFLQKEFRNRVMATLLSLLFVPVTILYFAIQYHFYGLNDKMLKLPVSAQDTGLSDIYFSVITFTTTGYGDITPGSMSCRAVAALEACMGYGYGAFLIASAVDLLGRARLHIIKESPSATNVSRTAID